MSWRFIKSGLDGDCNLYGVNIFNYEWINTKQKVVVKDPRYNQNHTFTVYKVTIDGEAHTFAAGEFSNCIWGFYEN